MTCNLSSLSVFVVSIWLKRKKKALRMEVLSVSVHIFHTSKVVNSEDISCWVWGEDEHFQFAEWVSFFCDFFNKALTVIKECTFLVYCRLLCRLYGPGSSVGITTDYGLDGLRSNPSFSLGSYAVVCFSIIFFPPFFLNAISIISKN